MVVDMKKVVLNNMDSFRDIGDDCYFLNMKDYSNSEEVIKNFGQLYFDLSSITYAEYFKHIKQAYSLEKCCYKVSEQYPLLYFHLNNKSDIDFIMGFSDFILIPELDTYYSKKGFFCYNQDVLDNKDLRKTLYSNLMKKVKGELDEAHRIFGEIPVISDKMKYYAIKYGFMKPCTDLKIVKSLIKAFNITVNSEPSLIESMLKDEPLKELAYETYYKPHSIYLVV